MDTQSDIYTPPVSGARATKTVLYVAFHGNAPMRAPSRHVLTGELVNFGRGKASAGRDQRDGLDRLSLRVDDPQMSADHGELTVLPSGAVLVDNASKNGALVGGIKTRYSKIELGQAFVLGSTVFLLAREELEAEAPLDLVATDLPAPVPELATFHRHLARSLERMARFAKTDTPVLLLGETGTGKELTARALHELSRPRGPFVAVNCAAIPSHTLESELFGHRRGAFTGAISDRLGHVRSSDRGTLFLDEIGDLPLSMQAALLRVLERREVVPLGESMPVPIDLRVCAATNRDLEALVAAEKYREDFYARIVDLPVTLPPLRTRRADLGLLVPALLRRQPHGERAKFTGQAAELLFTYSWPRNIRELERTLKIVTQLAGDGPVLVEHLREQLRSEEPAPATASAVAAAADVDDADDADSATPLNAKQLALKQELMLSLEKREGNIAEVARDFGKDRAQIYRWLRRFGIKLRGEGAW